RSQLATRRVETPVQAQLSGNQPAEGKSSQNSGESVMTLVVDFCKGLMSPVDVAGKIFHFEKWVNTNSGGF
ncbi:MAG: hypothetical protein NXI22_14500, partial [bacterium]|nr:hypothetical protein [bacterium]